jgi:hypothetical protein
VLESDQNHSFLQDNYSENCEENCQFKGKVKKLKSVQSSGTTDQIPWISNEKSTTQDSRHKKKCRKIFPQVLFPDE